LQAWQKVMAAYHRVDDLRSPAGRELTACTLGSAPGPTLGIEHGKPLPLPFTLGSKQTMQHNGPHRE